MTDQSKKDITQAIREEKKRLGSANKVANKCKVSPGTISQMLSGNWDLINDKMWSKVASGVRYDGRSWQIAEITNLKIMRGILDDAIRLKMFIPVAYGAGAGKTEGIRTYLAENVRPYNYHITCREWGRTDFLKNLMRCVGIDVPKGYRKADELGQAVIQFFVENKHRTPLLVIDQANSLRDSALRFIIHLYNEMEDSMGLVLVGTGALEKNIRRGVRYERDGFDEMESRLGRGYQYLIGAVRKDVDRICSANGITDRATQKLVFDKSNPIRKHVGQSYATVVEDMRRVKRVIQSEQKKMGMA